MTLGPPDLGEATDFPRDGLEALRIGASLSGGGYRAAAFGAGALLYLADAGLMPNVVTVSSVSGGSITNAFAASHIFAEDSSADTRGHWDRASALLRTLALHDLITIRPIVMGRIVAPVVLLVTIALTVSEMVEGTARTWTLVAAGVALALGAPFTYGVYMNLGLYGMVRLSGLLTDCTGDIGPASRGRTVTRMLGVLFYLYTLRVRKAAELMARLRRNVVRMGDIRSSFRPIFCTTDLASGTHFYISDRFVGGIGAAGRGTGSRGLRRDTVNLVGSARSMPLARAVVASAAYPGVIQPLVESSTVLGLPHRLGAVPKTIRLADGGLNDNLGFTFHKLWYDGSLAPALRGDLGPAPNLFVVVNSGIPDVSWLGGGAVGSIRRSIDIVHEAKGEARRELVVAFLERPGVQGVLVEISDDPYEISDSAAKPEWGDAVRAALASQVVDGQVPSRSWWRANGQEWSPSVKTRLDALGPSETARLVFHGYMVTLARMTSTFGFDVPAELPKLEAIEDLCTERPLRRAS